MEEQYLFNYNYDRSSSASRDGRGQGRRNRRALLQRAILKWLFEHDPPAAMATGVSTRISRFRADLAAFWSHKVRNPHREGPAHLLKPQRTMIIECYSEREECWPDCAHARSLVGALADWKHRRLVLEEEIRRHEPDLRDNDVLFSEYAEWRYEDSANLDYHLVQNKIMELEQALVKGTRFEKICRTNLADQLILAVPSGLVNPEEMADGWGLLWVDNDLSVEMRKPPDDRDCLAENRLHLVQNIASAATNAVLFSAGIQSRPGQGKEGRAIMVQPPRGHRRARRFYLNTDN